MKKNKRCLSILIVDDEEAPVQTLRRDAESSRFRMKLIHCTNLESAKEKIKSKGIKYFAGVILDAKCLTDKNQVLADGGFIGYALKYFQQETPHLPLVFLTGQKKYFDQIKECNRDYKVYDKGGDEIEGMLTYLRAQAEKLDYIRVTINHPDVFCIFEDEYLDSEAEQLLIGCLERMNAGDYGQINQNFIALRKIQEKIFRALIDRGIISQNFITEDKVPTLDILRELHNEGGLVKKFSLIDMLGSLIYNTSSTYGAHTQAKDHHLYQPTKYTSQTHTYAMMDLLLWFKDVVDKNDR